MPAIRRGDGISSVVKRIMKRADIVAPVKGAHALRHTAATEMLRHGVPLDKIGLVLRHRGIDTTYVGPVLQQMRRECVPQRVHCHRLAQAGRRTG